MRDFKLGTFPVKQPKKPKGPALRGFGYQVLGFGSGGPTFSGICASGGNSTVDVGIYKVHVFTSNGTFTVNATGDDDNNLQYLVVGGGGSGSGAGGGAGGYRTSVDSSAVTASAQDYPVVIGAGGTANQSPGSGPHGSNGSASSALSISSAGGGLGRAFGPGSGLAGGNGGSGGGGGGSPATGSGGSGNTPPVSPSQGNNGGSANHGPPPGGFNNMGGGGGAGESGNTPARSIGGAGRDAHTPIFGTGQPYNINNQPRCPVSPAGATNFFAGGGGGDNQQQASTNSGGGNGGGGDGNAPGIPLASGVTNSGGGGGGEIDAGCRNGNGGSGLVLIAYKTAAA